MKECDIQNSIKVISDAMINIAKDLIRKAPFDQTVKCRIKEVKSPGEYVVTIKGNDYTIKSVSSYSAGQFVHVLIPCGNYLDMIILG